MEEEPLKDLFQCYWWCCFLLFLIIDGSFSCRMSLYTCSMSQRKIHKALMSWRGATSPGSLLFWGGKENFSESNSRIRAHFKAYKSSPKGAVSVSWQQAWRLKSPVLKLTFVDTHCRAFYWTNIYFLFHRFLPHWVHWREEQAVSVLIYFSCQPLCQPVVFCFIYCQLFRSYSECRKHIIFQSNCEMRG